MEAMLRNYSKWNPISFKLDMVRAQLPSNWCPSRNQSLKINVDVSFVAGGSEGAFAGVLINASSALLDGFTEKELMLPRRFKLKPSLW
ncbi:hypothetical protein ACJRO7_019272 [Eucalyptus globulus]|uniref:RNase H type-1 domain-containing protein n=1 Tax=Eucalyptus globulus TaxID=34317 RepID=A0ABD3KPI3_EUCGL